MYRKRFYITIAMILAAGMFFTACTNKQDVENKIEAKVNEKLNNYIKSRLSKCRDRALEDAEVYVDSIIAEVTKNAVYKDMDFPSKPVRDTLGEDYEIDLDTFDVQEAKDSLIKTKNDSLLIQDSTYTDTIKSE